MAVAKTLDRFGLPGRFSRSCWLNAWTILIAPRTSLLTAPTSAIRSWLRLEIARTRCPSRVIGTTTSSAPVRIRAPASARAEKDDHAGEGKDEIAQRDRDCGSHHPLDDRRVDGILDVISAGRFSEEAGRQAEQVARTATMSATVRSPSQETKGKRTAVAIAITPTSRKDIRTSARYRVVPAPERSLCR